MAVVVKFKKLDPNAFVPQQMTEGAAGYDIAVNRDVTVVPNTLSSMACIVKTGIAMELPKGYYGEVVLRSSIGRDTKIRLANQVGIIDSDYHGEIMLYLENVGQHLEILKAGARIAQLIIKKYETLKTEIVDELSTTARGTKPSGSTGQ